MSPLPPFSRMRLARGGHLNARSVTAVSPINPPRPILSPHLSFPQVKAFADCCKGRLISVIWVCRTDMNAMNECLHQ